MSRIKYTCFNKEHFEALVKFVEDLPIDSNYIKEAAYEQTTTILLDGSIEQYSLKDLKQINTSEKGHEFIYLNYTLYVPNLKKTIKFRRDGK